MRVRKRLFAENITVDDAAVVDPNLPRLTKVVSLEQVLQVGDG